MTPRTEAAVLCGWQDSAAGVLADSLQRAMVPVGPRKLPLLHYVVRLVSSHGIGTITLLTGARPGDVEGYFGDGSSLGVRLKYSAGARKASGSLNALARALRKGVIPRCEELLLCQGDVLCDLDITALLQTHRKAGADATLVLTRGYTLPVGIAQVGRGNRVLAVREKPRLDLSVATGCLVAGARALDLVCETADAERTDLMAHFVPELLRSGGRVSGYFTDRAWYGVDTGASLEKLDAELRRPPLRALAGSGSSRGA